MQWVKASWSLQDMSSHILSCCFIFQVTPARSPVRSRRRSPRASNKAAMHFFPALVKHRQALGLWLWRASQKAKECNTGFLRRASSLRLQMSSRQNKLWSTTKYQHAFTATVASQIGSMRSHLGSRPALDSCHVGTAPATMKCQMHRKHTYRNSVQTTNSNQEAARQGL